MVVKEFGVFESMGKVAINPSPQRSCLKYEASGAILTRQSKKRQVSERVSVVRKERM